MIGGARTPDGGLASDPAGASLERRSIDRCFGMLLDASILAKDMCLLEATGAV